MASCGQQKRGVERPGRCAAVGRGEGATGEQENRRERFSISSSRVGLLALLLSGAALLTPWPRQGRHPHLLSRMALALATPAQAQTTTVLVSNFNETAAGSGASVYEMRQGFTTGSHPAGYTLRAIKYRTADATNGAVAAAKMDDLEISVWTVNSSGDPDRKQFTLTNPASVSRNATAAFRGPAEADLLPDTTYLIQVDMDGRSWELGATASGKEASSMGWTLADQWKGSSTDGGTLSDNTATVPFAQVEGVARSAAVTAPGVVSAFGNGTSLVITFNRTLAAAANLANSAFTVKKTVGTTEQTVTLSGTPALSGRTLTLTLATALANTDSAVKVSYTKPTTGSNNKLADRLGNQVAGFTDRAVTLLGAPASFKVVTGDEKATLSWEAPANLGGHTVTDYQYRYAAGASVPEGTAWISTGSALPALSMDEIAGQSNFRTGTDLRSRLLRIIGLENNRIYTFQVRAVSSNVSGAVASANGAPQPDNPPVNSGSIGYLHGLGRVGSVFYAADTNTVPTDKDGINNAARMLFIDSGETALNGDLDNYSLYNINLFRVDGSGTETPVSHSTTTITGRTIVTYTVTEADVGKRIRSKMAWEDDRGNANVAVYTFPDGGRTIRATAPCPVPSPVGGAVLSWTSTLSSIHSDLAPPEGGHGYGNTSDGSYGSLDNTTFAINGTTYTVTDFFQGIKYDDRPEASAGVTDIVLKLAPALPAGERNRLRLYVCDAPLRLADATVSDSGKTHTWSPQQRGPGADLAEHVGRTLYLYRDATALTVMSAQVSGATLTLTFNETLGAAANLANSAFTVKRTPEGGSEGTVSLSGTPAVSGKTLTLTLASALALTDSDVTVRYSKPTTGSNNKLVDTNGNEASDFQQIVTNRNPGVVLSQPRLYFYADTISPNSYTVTLNAQPTGNVTVTPTSSDTGAATVSPATLTFTTSSWNTARTVTVTAVEDADVNNETVTVSHGVTDGNHNRYKRWQGDPVEKGTAGHRARP